MVDIARRESPDMAGESPITGEELAGMGDLGRCELENRY